MFALLLGSYANAQSYDFGCSHLEDANSLASEIPEGYNQRVENNGGGNYTLDITNPLITEFFTQTLVRFEDGEVTITTYIERVKDEYESFTDGDSLTERVDVVGATYYTITISIDDFENSSITVPLLDALSGN